MPFLSTLGGGSNKGFLDQGQAIFNATGGSISTYTSGGKTWRSHTFLNSGTFSVSSGSNNLEVLIVAGGGGGGADNAGGGGAGGLLYYGTETPKTPNGGAITKSTGSYSVVVGNGGSGHTGPSDGSIGGGIRSANGDNSSVFGLTAIGGGGGVSSDAGAGAAGAGGSSGGNSGNTENPNGGSSASTVGGTSGQGNSGGQGSGSGGGGGGGGAAAAGSNGSGATGGSGGQGLAYAIRTGSSTYYAAGGNGGNENSQYGNNTTSTNGIGGITNTGGNSSRPTDGAVNTGSGGGGATHVAAMPSGAGGKGIVVIRYVPSVGGGATMAEWQDVPAGVYEIPTTNGAGSMNLEIIVLDGRKWAKIPYGTESVTGTWTGQNWVGSYRSLGNWGTVSNGNLYADGSARWTNDNEGSGPNVNAKQVTFNVGIAYRYVKVYCTAIQSHTSNSSGAPNCDWGGETGAINIWNLDLSGGYGDHPYWITGWDVNSGTPRYRGISGNTSSGSWISGGSGGWTGGEAGNVTRSFTSGTHDTGGNYVHDRLGLGIAGGQSEYYRHNSGYFLIS